MNLKWARLAGLLKQLRLVSGSDRVLSSTTGTSRVLRRLRGDLESTRATYASDWNVYQASESS
jgi:hypothetical protein